MDGWEKESNPETLSPDDAGNLKNWLPFNTSLIKCHSSNVETTR